MTARKQWMTACCGLLILGVLLLISGALRTVGSVYEDLVVRPAAEVQRSQKIDDASVRFSEGSRDRSCHNELSAIDDPKVVNLDFSECSALPNGALARLAKLPTLEVLRLPKTTRDDDLAEISSLEQLQSLSLRASGITDAGLKHVVLLPKLTALDLSFCTITDDGLAQIARLKELQGINLAETKITDRGVEVLVGLGLPQLAWFDLGSTRITDAAIPTLLRCPQLTRLDLYSTNVTDRGILRLRELQNLRLLGVGLTNVTHEGILRLKQDLPQLEVDAGG